MNRRHFLTMNAIAAAGLYIPSHVFAILPPHRRLQRMPAVVAPPPVVSGGGAFDPTAPGSVWGYWKAGTGITQSGGVVSAWADQSGNSKNLVQATGTKQPAYNASGLNGYGILTFDGTDDYLSTGGYDAAFIQPFSIVAVLKPITWTSNAKLISGQGGSWLCYYDTTPTILEYSAGGLAVKASATIGTWTIITMVFNGTSSLIQIGNSASVGGATTAHTAPMQDLELGAHYDGTVPANMACAELITYKKALSTAEISTLVAGYKTKFAI